MVQLQPNPMLTRQVDPRAQAAMAHLRCNRTFWVGPIMPHSLPAALSRHGDRHSWRDAVPMAQVPGLSGVEPVITGDPQAPPPDIQTLVKLSASR